MVYLSRRISGFAPLNWHLIFMEAFEGFEDCRGPFVVPGSLSQFKLVQTGFKSPSRAEKSRYIKC